MLPILMLLATLRLGASSIDATNLPGVSFDARSELSIDFGVRSYGANNPGFPPYPTTVGLLIAGAEPSVSDLATIPGTSIQYFSGYVFQGWLEASDGSASIPLYDPDAVLLGLPAGDLLLTPGTVTARGNTFDVAVLNASVSMSLEDSEALFGSNIASYNDAASFELSDLGQSFSIGLGPGYTVRNSIWEPDVQGLGPVQTCGITGEVMTANPEPSTILTLVFGLALLWIVRSVKLACRRPTGTTSRPRRSPCLNPSRGLRERP